MIDLKSVLVPVDFSEMSLHAVEHGIVVAGRFDAKLILAHVIAPLPPEYTAYDGGTYVGASWPSMAALEVEAKERMDALVDKLEVTRPIEKAIVHGDPAREIARLTRERNVDLVMMPTHGYGTFRRLVLGSVTSKVLHDVTCPVFTGVHVPKVIPFNSTPYRRIACAVDLREHSEAVLRWAWNFAQKWESDLILIHAAPRVGTPGPHGDWYPPNLQADMMESAGHHVAELVRKVGCKAKVYFACADPGMYVRSVAEESNANVLVIGRSLAEGVLDRLFTHAYVLIREAPCPVISV